MDGVKVSVMACFINSCQCQPIHPSLVIEGQSLVCKSDLQNNLEVETIKGKHLDVNKVEWLAKWMACGLCETTWDQARTSTEGMWCMCEAQWIGEQQAL